MRIRLRLLPVAIIAAAIMLSVKVRDMWSGLDVVMDELTVSASYAETASSDAASAVSHKEASSEGGGHGATASSSTVEETGLQLDAETFDPMLLSPAEIELLQNLQVRRGQLEEREREFALRAQVLDAAQAALDEKIETLKALEKRIETLMGQFDETREARMKSLVKIYENMKPKDAAKIFAELDGDILLDVVERMREAKAAPILALLNPARAKQITIDLAARSEPPK